MGKTSTSPCLRFHQVEVAVRTIYRPSRSTRTMLIYIETQCLYVLTSTCVDMTFKIEIGTHKHPYSCLLCSLCDKCMTLNLANLKRISTSRIWDMSCLLLVPATVSAGFPCLSAKSIGLLCWAFDFRYIPLGPWIKTYHYQERWSWKIHRTAAELSLDFWYRRAEQTRSFRDPRILQKKQTTRNLVSVLGIWGWDLLFLFQKWLWSTLSILWGYPPGLNLCRCLKLSFSSRYRNPVLRANKYQTATFDCPILGCIFLNNRETRKAFRQQVDASGPWVQQVTSLRNQELGTLLTEAAVIFFHRFCGVCALA